MAECQRALVVQELLELVPGVQVEEPAVIREGLGEIAGNVLADHLRPRAAAIHKTADDREAVIVIVLGDGSTNAGGTARGTSVT